jgi:tetratricopeptide (TPR) repeat protein
MRRRRWSEALDAFTRALEIDGDSSRAHLGAAAASLKLRRNEAAAHYALSGVGLLHHAPRGHYMLGVALARLGHWERAEVALRTALAMAPAMKPARRILAAVLRRKTAAALRA